MLKLLSILSCNLYENCPDDDVACMYRNVYQEDSFGGFCICTQVYIICESMHNIYDLKSLFQSLCRPPPIPRSSLFKNWKGGLKLMEFIENMGREREAEEGMASNGMFDKAKRKFIIDYGKNFKIWLMTKNPIIGVIYYCKTGEEEICSPIELHWNWCSVGYLNGITRVRIHVAITFIKGENFSSEITRRLHWRAINSILEPLCPLFRPIYIIIIITHTSYWQLANKYLIGFAHITNVHLLITTRPPT